MVSGNGAVPRGTSYWSNCRRSVTVQSPAATLISLIFSSKRLGADILVYWLVKMFRHVPQVRIEPSTAISLSAPLIGAPKQEGTNKEKYGAWF